MGVMEEFFKNLNDNIIVTLRELIKQEIACHQESEWMNAKQLAEYLGVSQSWVYSRIDEIPHSAVQPPRFKRSMIDSWMLGEQQKTHLTTVSMKKDVYRIGKKA